MPPCFRPLRRLVRCGLALALAAPLAGQVRSALYPADWAPPGPSASFAADKLLQDFSYAGYRRGEVPVPALAGPFFDALDYGADPSGAADSTDAIRAALAAAKAAGGGVVRLPAGLFRLSSRGGEALRLDAPGVVLRGAGAGQTRLLGTETAFRGKALIRVAPAATPSESGSTPFTADVVGPATRLYVSSPGNFAVGQFVAVRWSFTDAWIAEHGQQAYWSATNGALGAPADAVTRREVLEVNAAEGWIRVDIPLRYHHLVRDNARVARLTGLLTECGIEDLSLGFVQHPGTGFGESDYEVSGTVGYDVHDSWAIILDNARDCWVRRVSTFRAEGNTSTAHLLSNGLRVRSCHRVTVQDCSFQRPQYGGGGGNGYMLRLQNSSDCLVERFTAEYSRHGMMISHASSTGNVLLDCLDRETKRATGAGAGYETSGSSSDNHMHFSHSNLYDRCVAENSFYASAHRGTSGSVPVHGLSAAHNVYWNVRGEGTRYPQVVKSTQARYGYVIGTSGAAWGVNTSTASGGDATTKPDDHTELLGRGGQLQPQSLYLDQRARRIGLGVRAASSGPAALPSGGLDLSAEVFLAGAPAAPETVSWRLLSAPPGGGGGARAGRRGRGPRGRQRARDLRL